MTLSVASGARVLFAGDPHGEFAQVREAVARETPDAVVMLGDYELKRPLHAELSGVLEKCEVYWIPGNHDTADEHSYDYLFGSALGQSNLHGKVTPVGGLRIAGLGGVFRGRLWFPGEKVKFRSRDEWLRQNPRGAQWRGGIPRLHRSSIWREDYEALWGQRADVLVCHEAPTSHENGFQAIDDLGKAMGVRLIVHGHHHRDYVGFAKNGIPVVGVGLRSVAKADGDLVARRGRRERELRPGPAQGSIDEGHLLESHW